MIQNCSIYLASRSPRRSEILTKMGLVFKITESLYKEEKITLPPEELVGYLSMKKATEAVIPEEDCLIIGADTAVSFQDRILGKPENEEDAFQMLRLLSGNTSYVYTGVYLYKVGKNSFSDGFVTKTEVCIDELSDEEILSYIKTGEPTDKAGAYGIQGVFGRHIKGISGDYYNVMGLPMNDLYRKLSERNIISHEFGT